MRPALYPVVFGSRNPLNAYGRAAFLFDTARSKYRNGSAEVRRFDDLPGLTFTRALAAYAPNSAGVLQLFASGAPRITDRGLLIEGARTNLCLRSQEFDNASWTKSRATVTADALAAPDATTTADKLVEDSTAASTHRIFQSISKAASATQYSYSCVLKAGERTFVHLVATGAAEANGAGVGFDLGAGSAGTPYSVGGAPFTALSASVTALADGWYRCTFMFTTDTDTVVVPFIMLATGTSSASRTYSGNGTSGAYVWGAQLEAAAFPSSYIPTTTASVTRPGDADPLTVSGYGSSISGMVNFRRLVDTGGVEVLMQIDDGTANNLIRLAVDASDRGELLIVAGGVTQAQIAVTGALSLNTRHGISFSATTNSAKVCVNGTLGTEDTSVTMPTGLTTLRLAEGVSIATPSFGQTERAAAWLTTQADAALQAMAVAA